MTPISGCLIRAQTKARRPNRPAFPGRATQSLANGMKGFRVTKHEPRLLTAARRKPAQVPRFSRNTRHESRITAFFGEPHAPDQHHRSVAERSPRGAPRMVARPRRHPGRGGGACQRHARRAGGATAAGKTGRARQQVGRQPLRTADEEGRRADAPVAAGRRRLDRQVRLAARRAGQPHRRRDAADGGVRPRRP